MNDTRKGKIYGLFFILFLILLAVGGYFLTKEIIKDKDEQKPITQEEEQLNEEKLKINKDEEYIYFENSDSKSLEHEIVYQDIVFNINSTSALNLATKLNNEMENLKSTYKVLSEQTLTEEEQEKILYKEDDIYSANFRKYTRYFYKNYASILLEDYTYDCFNGSSYKASSSYVIDTTTGNILTKNELLQKYNYNLDKLKSTIKTELEKEQTMIEEVPLIDVTSTLNNLDNDELYALYINKSGFLTISYLVKTTQNDYNDVIILN